MSARLLRSRVVGICPNSTFTLPTHILSAKKRDLGTLVSFITHVQVCEHRGSCLTFNYFNNNNVHLLWVQSVGRRSCFTNCFRGGKFFSKIKVSKFSNVMCYSFSTVYYLSHWYELHETNYNIFNYINDIVLNYLFLLLVFNQTLTVLKYYNTADLPQNYLVKWSFSRKEQQYRVQTNSFIIYWSTRIVRWHLLYSSYY